jgi:hypothetical protein
MIALELIVDEWRTAQVEKICGTGYLAGCHNGIENVEVDRDTEWRLDLKDSTSHTSSECVEGRRDVEMRVCFTLQVVLYRGIPRNMYFDTRGRLWLAATR